MDFLIFSSHRVAPTILKGLNLKRNMEVRSGINNLLRIFIFFSFILFISSAFSQSSLEIHEIKKNVFVYTTYQDVNGYRFPSNGLYLVANEGIIIIDTPWDSLQFQPFLDSLEHRHHKKAILSISTHFHNDRTAGLDFFKRNGVKTYTSQKTFDFCKTRNEPTAEFTFLKDTTFSFSDMQLETFYHGEGHSPDNIVVYLKNDQILFGGCLIKSLENSSLGNIADANLKDWSTSVQRVIDKYPEAKIVIPGHFSWSDKKALKHTIKLLNKM